MELTPEQQRINKLNADVNSAMETKAPTKVSAVNPDLMAMREKFLKNKTDEANQTANSQLQQGQDALTRKFASMGASGSGAQIAAMANNQKAAEDARRVNLQGVADQELQLKEADVNRDFQSSMADRDMEFKQKLSNMDQANKLKGMDMAERQFLLDKETTEFNKQMALLDAEASGKKLGPMGKQISASFSPGGGFLNDTFGDAAKLMNPIASGLDDAGKAIAGAVGTLICTELHSQGFISDKILTLDSRFGREFKQSGSEIYKGYLIFAAPTVKLMKKSKLFSKLIASIFVPWCHWMGHKYDKSVPHSYRGAIVFHVMKYAFPILYKLNKLSKEVKIWA